MHGQWRYSHRQSANTHWASMGRTVWIREAMERDEETKSCHSDDFPAAPFKHLRHLSPSLMLPHFDFLLLMRLYVQIAPSVSFSVCLYFRMRVLRVNLNFLKLFSWLSKLWEIYLIEQNWCCNESCHCRGFAIFEYSDNLIIGKTCVELSRCQAGVIVWSTYHVSVCKYFPWNIWYAGLDEFPISYLYIILILPISNRCGLQLSMV